MEPNTLTDQEKLFCELYVDGSAPYAGNAAKCYSEVFKTEAEEKLNGHLAKQLIARQEIQSYIEELQNLSYEEAKHLKNFLTANLKHIVEETSSAVYKDKRGKDLSPAPLRSVAVAASKALMDMYPVKEVQQHKLNDGDGGAGIIFNVIIPGQTPTDSSNGETKN